MSASWRYVLTPPAQRDLRRLNKAVQRRILDALRRYTSEGLGDVKKLQGKDDEWRLRVGSWRVRFKLDSQNLIVVALRVLPRSQAYRE